MERSLVVVVERLLEVVVEVVKTSLAAVVSILEEEGSRLEKVVVVTSLAAMVEVSRLEKVVVVVEVSILAAAVSALVVVVVGSTLVEEVVNAPGVAAIAPVEEETTLEKVEVVNVLVVGAVAMLLAPVQEMG